MICLNSSDRKIYIPNYTFINMIGLNSSDIIR